MSIQRNLAKTTIVPLLVGGLALLGTAPAAAGGFGFFPQGSKAMGLAGAFVAQADDPTAVFYNIGGLVLGPDDKKVATGVTTRVLNESLYQGLPPGIGAGTTGAQAEITSLQPHAYGVLKLGPNTKVGLGVTSPFLLDTEWNDPGDFAGRAITTTAELTTYDLIAGVSQRLGANFGIGVGIVYRGSELTHDRRLQRVDPATGGLVDVGSVAVDTDFSDGIGWTAGFSTARPPASPGASPTAPRSRSTTSGSAS